MRRRHSSKAGIFSYVSGLTATAATDNVTADDSDDGTDTDGDGLTDYIENLVGTDSEAIDTDMDLITDTLEVVGVFTFPDGKGGTRTWFTDPESADTNGDGLTDGVEWDNNGDGAIDDTDGDTVPDLFDDDNDNDGVPDGV